MNKILVVVDMQNDFITGSLGTPEAVEVLGRVEHKVKFLPEDTGTIFTMDTHYSGYLNTLEGKMLPVEHCIRNTEGWLIPDCLLKHYASPLIIHKPTFGSLDLMGYLRDMCEEFPIEEIEFCGLCTDICVISNVLMCRANFPDMKIVVDSSLCAGVTPEKHEAALEVMRSCQVEVI